MPASLDGLCVYLIDSRSLHIGHLKKRTAAIVRKLTETDGIVLQFEVCRRRRRPQEPLLSVSPRRTSGKSVLELSITIYGPVEHADKVGKFLVHCELYLQDPQRCDLQVPYRNPQSFWAQEGDESRVIQDTAPVSEQQFFKAPPDLLQDLEYDGELAKAQQPSALKTELRE